MHVLHGSTGATRRLKPEEAKKVARFITERQQHGKQLAKALTTKGFALDSAYIVDHLHDEN
jgi:hypothetical protein